MRIARSVLTFLLALTAFTLFVPAASATDSVGYPYKFSDVANGYGPCWDGNVKQTIVSATPTSYTYQRKTSSYMSGPNIKIETRTENAFNSLRRITYCSNSYPRLALYGYNKVSRLISVHWTCYGDGRCQMIGYYPKAWQNGWR